ncbi:non-canonical purine NTP diphosphatase [Flavobacterium sp. NKUCC04_CG]|uniref:non-canonical purine NTP diphosphatase n=1 Tax=Flavobacterium sp. NKUCC04_CG TaxID=2842121 RepID=UPI001C5B9FB7|nr:non-canonical purine NTP diphosphatase [Flavobacterium sp. NKUCC04_CG]MBW3519087.1 non-canonical purine NTP diphosphatase [Flavobacterium sp. NKUCC04_CG]
MKLIFASNNKNKIAEIRNQLPPTIEILSLEDIGCVIDIPETSDTIAGNALQKADFIKRHYGYDCFADDTGLEVDALNGAPGVYSARFAGPQRNDSDNIDKLLKDLEGHTDRKANFKTVIALHVNGQLKMFSGIVDGEITPKRIGSDGFGYDPVFKPLGMKKTFAEMSMTEKNQMSHRGKAVAELIAFLKSQ